MTPSANPVTRMRARLLFGPITAAILVLSSCSMRPGINPALEQEALTPPRPIGGGGPALVGATLQSPISLEILVQVDTLGRADLSTLKITGQGVEPNRTVITEWLRTARFEPARLNGYLVRGWYNALAEAKAVGAR